VLFHRGEGVARWVRRWAYWRPEVGKWVSLTSQSAFCQTNCYIVQFRRVILRCYLQLLATKMVVSKSRDMCAAEVARPPRIERSWVILARGGGSGGDVYRTFESVRDQSCATFVDFEHVNSDLDLINGWIVAWQLDDAKRSVIPRSRARRSNPQHVYLTDATKAAQITRPSESLVQYLELLSVWHFQWSRLNGVLQTNLYSHPTSIASVALLRRTERAFPMPKHMLLDQSTPP
jgi:hypothetical protein